jgi:hypothetical protein
MLFPEREDADAETGAGAYAGDENAAHNVLDTHYVLA